MAQNQKIRVLRKDGTIEEFNSLEEAQRAVSGVLVPRAQAEPQPVQVKPQQVPPLPFDTRTKGALQPDNNVLQDILDMVRNSISGGQAAPGFPGKGMAGDAVNMATHPMQEAPTIGALALSGVATAAMPQITIPAALVRAMAAGAGGAMGSMVRMDQPEEVVQHGVTQAAMQGLMGEIPMLGAKHALLPFARNQFMRQMAPSPSILSEVRNPATGLPFETQAEAIEFMKQFALDSPNRPGPGKSGVRYYQDFRDKVRALSTEKQDVLRSSDATFPKETAITPRSSFKPQYDEAYTSRDEPAAEKQIESTIKKYMNKRWPTQTTTHQTLIPSAPGPTSPLTPPTPASQRLLAPPPSAGTVSPFGEMRPQLALPPRGGTSPASDRTFFQGQAGTASSAEPHRYDTNFLSDALPPQMEQRLVLKVGVDEFGNPTRSYDFKPTNKPFDTYPEGYPEAVDIGAILAAERGPGLRALPGKVDTPPLPDISRVPGEGPQRLPRVSPDMNILKEIPDVRWSGRGLPSGEEGVRFPPTTPKPSARPTQGTPDPGIEQFPNVRTGPFEITQPNLFKVGPPPPVQYQTSTVTSPRDLSSIEVDAFVKGLDHELAKLRQAQQVRAQSGATAVPDFDFQTLAQIRRNWAGPLAEKNPEIVPLNELMSQYIPLQKAARQAARTDYAHDASARIGGRADFGRVEPKWYQFWNFKPGSQGQAARNTANMITSPTGRQAPNLFRLAYLLSQQGQEEER